MIAVLTTGRQDWGILRSTCLALTRSSVLDVAVVAGGMHLEAKFGETIQELHADGVKVAHELRSHRDSPALEAAVVLERLPQILSKLKASALLLVGDRSETAAAALAATLSTTPIVHLHGGEETEGAIDNALRHAITKMAHFHLVSHPDHRARVIQLGEPEESVHVVGAPGLDNLRRLDLPDRSALERQLGLELQPPVLLVTYHPTTLGADPRCEVGALTGALRDLDATIVITLPNSDLGGDVIRDELRAFAAEKNRVVTVEALGATRYFGLLHCVDALVGNSSSALIEAPALAIPAVNIGDRQKGRLRGSNVLDVPADAVAIEKAIARALKPEFREQLLSDPPLFGDGRSAERIVSLLEGWSPPNPPRKRFVVAAGRGLDATRG